MTTGVVAHLFWGDEILLILRDDIIGVVDRGKWDSLTETMEPEDGGDFGVAMRRGLMEEIGIIPASLHFLGLTRQAGHGFFCGFLTKEEAAAICLGEEGQDFRFYTLTQTQRLPLGASFRNHYEAYPAAFEKMAQGIVPVPHELRLTTAPTHT